MSSIKLQLDIGATVNQGLNGQTALMYSIRQDNAELIQLLLDHGARVDIADSRGRTALHKACASRHVTAAELLLRAGASMFVQDEKGVHPWGIAQLDSSSGIARLFEWWLENAPTTKRKIGVDIARL